MSSAVGIRTSEEGPAFNRSAGLRDLALLGDCQTAALVDGSGRIVWACFPDFSGDPVFGALLDARIGGAFTLFPSDVREVRRRYLPGTPVLESDVRTATGAVRLTDAILALDGEDDGIEPETEILRLVEVTDGTVDIALRVEPRRDYGRRPMRIARRGRLGYAFSDRGRIFHLGTDIAAGLAMNGDVIAGQVRLHAGERRHVSLSSVTREAGVVPMPPAAARGRMDATRRWWEAWSGRLRWNGPYRDDVLRSALCLKLLTHATSGAVVAAPTTSLPETRGGSRNWDYRFCWLRDASLTVRALVRIGCMDEAGAFLDWLLHATRRTHPRLRVLYDIWGRKGFPERTLPHLDGWRGARPVRVGNAAGDQFQLDGYGQIVAAAAEFVAAGGEVGATQARYLVGFGHLLSDLWKEPDAGIWEIRGPHRHYTHSKLLCWVAMDCLVRLAADGTVDADPAPFARDRDRIRRYIEETAFDPERGYLAAPGLPVADASLLTMPRYGFLDARDPRFLRTFETIDRDLRVGDGLILRYPSDFDRQDGAENAFGICSFWAVEALARMGRIEEADRRMRALLPLGGQFGLLAEEIEGTTGELLGNYPQAFSHVGLILAAEAIGDARRRDPA